MRGGISEPMFVGSAPTDGRWSGSSGGTRALMVLLSVAGVLACVCDEEVLELRGRVVAAVLAHLCLVHQSCLVHGHVPRVVRASPLTPDELAPPVVADASAQLVAAVP